MKVKKENRTTLLPYQSRERKVYRSKQSFTASKQLAKMRGGQLTIMLLALIFVFQLATNGEICGTCTLYMSFFHTLQLLREVFWS